MSLLFALVACTDSSTPPPAPASRVDAVAAAPVKEVTSGQFCESQPNVDFTWPELDSAAPADADSWTWVNAWATWCKPCVGEMPMLVKWQKRLEDAGLKVALRFLSMDAHPEDVQKFYAAHPEVPQGVRIKDVALLPGWLPKVSLGADVALPIHFFLGPDHKIACIRTGSLGEADYEGVKAVLSGK